ncbi:DNA translocase FtsK 4TM domain-containing protein [Candidatus Saccharibacteria bacterium]|nr:DNA translocase FtsK 4TM domain-containing protein [Candidatus Saccharibacteria bacterium]
MAKKRKTARKSTKKVEDSKASGGFWRGLGAVTLIIAGIVLLFGVFISAPIPQNMWDGFWWAFGVATIIAPLVLIYLGLTKFLSEDQRIPLAKMAGSISLLVFLASWLHTMFMSQDAFGVITGGHGGHIGQAVGNLLFGALGKFLASLVFFVLTIFAVLFTFAIEPRSLLKLAELFKREKSDEEEDLAALKSKMAPGFQLNEGVPVEHHGAGVPTARMTSLRNSAQKMAPEQDHAALTVASDPDWKFPPLDLLSDKQDKADAGDVKGNAEIIKDTFAQFNYDVEVEGANVGPRVTQFTLKPPQGVKLEKIESLDKNLAYGLEAQNVRIEAPIPGKRAVGIEVPNKKSATVTLRSILSSAEWQAIHDPLAFVVGKDIAGTPIVADLEDMPHVLIAGQTKAGKSVMINSLLGSLLYRNSPSDLKLILIDPKHVEMAPYDGIPHLIAPVINEPEKCISALKWAVAEMDRRLKTFATVKQRDIQGYNQLKNEEGMPYIVIVIDELADLMMVAARDVEALVVRIAQKARAAGIHLVLATQRPSVDVITGLIKANVPGRIAFTVVQQVDSRTIIDQIGAEKLLGRGDMLFKTSDMPKPKRMQGALISGSETNKVCDFLRSQRPPQYNEEVVSQPVQLGKGGVVASIDNDDDDAWKDAVAVVVNTRKASTSLLQRKLRIGYGRASRLMDMMEEQGIIAPSDGTNRPREVLVNSVDEVFAAEPVAAEASNPDGDVYDDMPDDEPPVS